MGLCYLAGKVWRRTALNYDRVRHTATSSTPSEISLLRTTRSRFSSASSKMAIIGSTSRLIAEPHLRVLQEDALRQASTSGFSVLARFYPSSPQS